MARIFFLIKEEFSINLVISLTLIDLYINHRFSPNHLRSVEEQSWRSFSRKFSCNSHVMWKVEFLKRQTKQPPVKMKRQRSKILDPTSQRKFLNFRVKLESSNGPVSVNQSEISTEPSATWTVPPTWKRSILSAQKTHCSPVFVVSGFQNI